MKFDGIYLIQILIMVSLMTYMYMSFRQYGYEREKQSTLIVNSSMINFRVDFSRELTLKDYVTFEKIGIWRYSSIY
ncbi:MAG: hypothetical protein ACRDA5_10020 [Clostridium sp.]